MSGGHGHDSHSGHAGAHGGHDAHEAHGGHGSTEIPPAPATREISPARDDYAQPWPGALLLWPVVWVGVAALLFVAARAWTGPVKTHEHAVHEGAPHEGPAAPGHEGEPAPHR